MIITLPGEVMLLIAKLLSSILSEKYFKLLVRWWWKKGSFLTCLKIASSRRSSFVKTDSSKIFRSNLKFPIVSSDK